MALSFWQKLQVAFRGWSRRREEREKEFLQRNTGWAPAPTGGGQAPSPVPRVSAKAIEVDREGLQVAYLDDSGQISYFLDTMSGEVIEIRNRPAPPGDRFRRVPSRTAESDAEERRAFVQSLDDSPAKQALMRHVDSPEFRKALAADRTLERAWYNFRNERATTTIESWLQTLGLRGPGRG